MEIDILEKKENKLLDRTEIKFNCLYDGESTPKLSNVKNKLVAMLNTKKGLIVVDSIQPHFGEAKAAGYAKIYDSQDSLKDIEPKHIIEKNREAKAQTDGEETINNTEDNSAENEPVEEESAEEKSTDDESEEKTGED